MKGDDNIINVLQSLDTSWMDRVANNFTNGINKILNTNSSDSDTLIADPVRNDSRDRELNELTDFVINARKMGLIDQ